MSQQQTDKNYKNYSFMYRVLQTKGFILSNKSPYLRKTNSVKVSTIFSVQLYSCGASVQDLSNDKAPRVSKVFEKLYVRDMRCNDDIETPYFSCKSFLDVCVKCGTNMTCRKRNELILCAHIERINSHQFLMMQGKKSSFRQKLPCWQKKVKSNSKM